MEKFNPNNENKDSYLDIKTDVRGGLPEEVADYFQKFCKENNLDPKEPTLDQVEYHIIELAKNAFEHGSGGKLFLNIIGDSIQAVVVDVGSEDKHIFNPIEDIEISQGQGYGLKEAMQYADTFSIETDGKKFIKSNNELIESGYSEVKDGTKIVFTKIINN